MTPEKEDLVTELWLKNYLRINLVVYERISILLYVVRGRLEADVTA